MKSTTSILHHKLIKIIGLLMLAALMGKVAKSQCNADFTYSVDTVSGDVHFTNTSTGLVPHYSWYFGASGTSTATNPVINFSPGSYYVCLFLTDSFCFDSTCKLVTVPGQVSCDADFDYTVDTLTGDVYFTNQSTGTATTSYYWSFDNGSSTSQNPVQNFSAGNHTVCLLVLDGNCFDSICKSIYVPGTAMPCNADFTAYSVDTTTTPFTYYFYSTASTGNNLTYYWTFGDGSSSSQANPSHQFSSPTGPYHICLTVTNMLDTTCTDTKCNNVFPPTPAPCEANFSYYIDSLGNVHMINQSTGSSLSYHWYTWDSVYTTADPVFHFEPGYQYVILEITGANNCFDSTGQLIYIPDPNSPCHADFRYDIDVSGDIHFTNMSTGSSLTYNWTFEGTTSSATDPTYQFAPGYYQVCLTIFGDSGCFDSTCQWVYVPCDTHADFTYYIDSVSGDVHFINNSIGDSLTYHWRLGDTISFDENPVYHFTPGYHYVMLFVTNGNCYDSISTMIYVPGDRGPCHAEFSYEIYPDSIDGTNRIVVFRNVSLGNNLVYQWGFGDGDWSMEENPIHYYPQDGEYTVCLTVIDTIELCADTICETIRIQGDSTTGLAQLKLLSDVHVYPVPFSNELKLDLHIWKGNSVLSVKIYNTLGQVLLNDEKETETGLNHITLNVDNLNRGIYFLELQTGDNRLTYRIVK